MQNFDWRWIGAIAVIVLLTQIRYLPPYIMAAVLAGGGAYFVSIGWKAWTNGGGTSTPGRVTYWRGQRIEAPPPKRGFSMPRGRDLGQALVFLLLGGVMVLAAGSMILNYLR